MASATMNIAVDPFRKLSRTPEMASLDHLDQNFLDRFHSIPSVVTRQRKHQDRRVGSPVALRNSFHNPEHLFSSKEY